jgi:VanZ family protein
MSSKKKIIFSWSLVILCALSIFLIVPIARTISNFVKEHWDVSLFGYSVLVVVFIAFLFSLYYLWHRLKIRSFSNYFWLAAVASVYVYFTLKLWERPEEAIHFLEYGLLGFLLFKAFRHHIHDKSIYLAAFLLGSIIGIFDEILQWMITDRYWDMRDIGLNALSVGLCQIAIWRGLSPDIPKTGISPKSIKILSWLLATNLLLLGICSSNTPNRVRSYTKSLPFLSFLNEQEPMNEHTHKHRDPEIGVFFSRLSLTELAEIDNQRAEEYGGIFKAWAKKKYKDFLLYHPGYARPFLHEMRVHVFRRNRRFSIAKKADNQKEREENLLIAYKENLILEKYFGATLQKSPYKWQNTRPKQIEKEIDTTPFYRSPVSAIAHIPLDERLLWAIILLIILGLVFLNMRLSQKQKSA